MTFSFHGKQVAAADPRSLRVMGFLGLLALGMGCAAAFAEDQNGKVQGKGPTSVTANPSSGTNGTSGNSAAPSDVVVPEVKSSTSLRPAARQSTGVGPLGPGAVQETLRPAAAGVAQPSSGTGPGGHDGTTVPQPSGAKGPKAASDQTDNTTAVKREQAQPLPK